jgi:hypothetical protein
MAAARQTRPAKGDPFLPVRTTRIQIGTSIGTLIRPWSGPARALRRGGRRGPPEAATARLVQVWTRPSGPGHATSRSWQLGALRRGGRGAPGVSGGVVGAHSRRL